MKIKELLQKLGTTNTSLARWIAEFGDYFSEGAKLRHREFTHDDLNTLATVAKLSQDGMNYDAIREKLATGYRDEFAAANFGVDTLMIPAAAVEQIIDSTEIRSELEAIRLDHARLLAETQRKDERIDTLQQRIAELERALGKAEGRLQEIEKPTKRRWFG